MTFLSKLRTLIAATVIATFGANTGHAVVADFEFVTKSWNFGLNGGTGNNNALLLSQNVQGAGFTFGGRDIFLAGGFFHDGSLGAGVGTAVFSTGPQTYGPGNEPSAFTGSALFAIGFAPLITSDVTGGNIGFRTSTGNYGFIEFDWNSTSQFLTFLSGKYETVAGKSISTVSAVPLPAGLTLMLTGLLAFGALRSRCRRMA